MKKLTALLLCLLLLLTACQKTANEPDPEPSAPPVLHYAEGVTVVDDEDSLQDAVDGMLDKASQSMVVSYQGEAFSEDGENFSCYIANSDANPLDMYIGIYLGEDLSDELFLSGLIRPGQVFEQIQLEHPLEKGSYDCYLTMTQVEDDHATIHGQVVLGITLTVS